MKLELYKVVNRELQHVKSVQVPDDLRDFDKWLVLNGYGRDYTLRRGIVQDISKAEALTLQREHDRLKRAGKLPSVLGRMIEEISQNKS